MAISPVKTFPKKMFQGVRNFWNRGGSNEFYAGGMSDQRRFGRGKLARDIADIMSENRQKMQLGDSRYIYQSSSTVSGAVRQKADYVYGKSWQLQSKSLDADFRAAVEADFKKIDKLIDMRGKNFGFRKSIWLGSKTLDVDGDYFLLLTEDKKTGFPKIQHLEAHRVGDFENSQDGTVQEGRYKGFRIQQGVIVDQFQSAIAYRIKDDSNELGWRDTPASSVIHVCDYEWFSQTRGQPTVAAAILDWYDISETKDAQKIKVKVTSALNLIESNESGTKDNGNPFVNPNAGAGARFQTELVDSGLIRYIKNGGNLTAHTANDPSNGWLKFIENVETAALYAMRWRREMIDSSNVGGAGVRAFQSDINKSIGNRCEVLQDPHTRAALYIIAKRAKMGAYTLPDDWYKIGFTKPAEFTVDEGRMRSADIEDLRAGLTTEDTIVEARGHDYEELLRKRAANIRMKNEIAAEFEIDASELGTLSKPGDPVEPNNEGNQNE